MILGAIVRDIEGNYEQECKEEEYKGVLKSRIGWTECGEVLFALGATLVAWSNGERQAI
jgi:hypothetical protein